MRLDDLFPRVPPVSGEHCCKCGRWTEVPVVIGYGSMSGGASVTHYVCAQHVHTRSPCTADHTQYE
ncbi:hypothetical protein [Streptomyces uncialis]|uniref:hypothetical protein n=1 Tax=Streptomyces uncialis TaxID=1048205 RepID=UPI000AFC095A|nr:hypothetical protein [Streptomyces uncialis]MCX4663788.1 hypothetical protein [Streptomyces uncialis]